VTGFTGNVVDPTTGAAVTSKSGPDGVVIVADKEIWAGDGDSTVKVIDIKTRKITDTISTGGTLRVDEMAYDPTDNIVAMANNADTPPFVTMISTTTHKIIDKITFDGTNGTPDATATGIEQPQYSPQTGMFYVSVPQIDPATASKGGVSVIDPITLKVVKTYEVDNCTPGGLALGPNNEALIGCSGSFGTPATTQSVIINLLTGATTSIPQVGGNDEVWYDPSTHHYYLGARSNLTSGKPNPVLGTIDALTKIYDGGVSTSTTAHSVAADRRSHHVFVPIGFVPPGSAAGTDSTNPCPTAGCIGVYLPSSIDDDDQKKMK
jgi:hypothetical protein